MEITKTLVSSEHGFDDFDIAGMPPVHRVCIPHTIKKGEAFNVYCANGVKVGTAWKGSVEESLAFLAQGRNLKALCR